MTVVATQIRARLDVTLAVSRGETGRNGGGIVDVENVHRRLVML